MAGAGAREMRARVVAAIHAAEAMPRAAMMSRLDAARQASSER